MIDWQTGSKKLWIRLIALVLVELFLFTSIDWPFEQSNLAYAQPTEQLVPPYLTDNSEHQPSGKTRNAEELIAPKIVVYILKSEMEQFPDEEPAAIAQRVGGAFDQNFSQIYPEVKLEIYGANINAKEYLYVISLETQAKKQSYCFKAVKEAREIKIESVNDIEREVGNFNLLLLYASTQNTETSRQPMPIKEATQLAKEAEVHLETLELTPIPDIHLTLAEGQNTVISTTLQTTSVTTPSPQLVEIPDNRRAEIQITGVSPGDIIVEGNQVSRSNISLILQKNRVINSIARFIGVNSVNKKLISLREKWIMFLFSKKLDLYLSLVKIFPDRVSSDVPIRLFYLIRPHLEKIGELMVQAREHAHYGRNEEVRKVLVRVARINKQIVDMLDYGEKRWTKNYLN